MGLDYEKLVEQGFESIATAVPNPDIVLGGATFGSVPLAIVLYPTYRNDSDLPAIASTYHYPQTTQLLYYQQGTVASLLYNLDLFDHNLQRDYPMILDKILSNPIHNNKKSALIFFKKFLTAVSNSSLDILTLYYKKPSLYLDNEESFINGWKTLLYPIFTRQIDKQGIWTQYTRMCHHIPEIYELTLRLVYITIKKWQDINLSVLV